MDVKSGYKETEIGVIPTDWDLFELHDACERIAVGLATSVTKHYRPSGVPIVRNLNIKDGFFDGRDMLYVSTEFAKANTSKSARAFDVLTVRTGANLGDTCVLPAAFDNCQTFTTLITTPKRSLLTPRFLCLHMSSFSGKKEMNRLQVGSGKGNLNTGELKRYRIGAPPLREQESIAEALSDANALVESLELLIAKKRELKQSAMQELLTGKTRLPGFSAVWNVKRLGDLGSTFGGLSGKRKSDFGNGHSRYITFMNIMTNVVIDRSTFEQVNISSTESQNRVAKGDLFFNGSSETPEEVGMCAVLTEEVQDVYLNSFCFGFRFSEEANADGLYLAYYFRSGKGRKLLRSLAQGAIRYNLSKSALLKVAFPLPLLPEQTAIAAVLSDMDAEIAALEAKAAKARHVKQAMMQELLTGKVRLV